jgi:membrane protease YdiL (CAAX protease family)
MSSSSELDLASWPRRLAACAIDTYLMMVVLVLLLYFVEPARTGREVAVAIALLASGLVYHAAGVCRGHVSLGRRMAGITVVPVRGTAAKVSVRRALLRTFVRGASLLLALFVGAGMRQEWMLAVPLLIDLALILRKGRRSVADWAAGTAVVRAPALQHREPPRSTLSLLEAAVVTCICFGLFTFWSFRAVAAGLPDVHLSNETNGLIIGLELTMALVALVFLRWRGFDIASLYPAPSLRQSLLGLVLFSLCWLAGWLATTAMLPWSSQWRSIEFSAAEVSLVAIVLLAIVNGTFEEVFLLGVLVRGLRTFGLPVAIGISLLVRVLYHLYQGPEGAVWVGAFGLTLTLAYVATRRLWPAVVAHILWDIVPLV